VILWRVSFRILKSLGQARWCAAMLISSSGFFAAGCANASGGGHSHRRQQQHLVSVPWDLASAKHNLVTIRYQVPTCTYAFARTTARETAATVTIGVYYRYTGPLPRGYACTADARLDTRTVRLRSPLDHRRLLHAP